MQAAPTIDYRQHPAFAQLPPAAAEFNHEVDAQLAALDAAFLDCEQAVLGTDPQATAETAVTLKQLLGALSAQIEHGPIADEFTRRWLTASVEACDPALLEELRITVQRTRSAARGGVANPATTALREDGVATLPLPAGSGARWLQACQPLCAVLRARAQAQPAVRHSAGIPLLSRAGRAIRANIERSGGWAVAEQYQGAAQEIEFFDLHYSHSGQTWYRDCYADLGLPTSPYAYVHHDHSPGSLKMMVYLSPVTPSNGPFHFLPGSHRWPRSMMRHVLGKQLDRQHRAVFNLSCADGYYRPRFHIAEERRRFAGLPSGFQLASHFGDDVLPGSALADLIATTEQPFLQADTLVLFNGSRGMHRGAQCIEGERWVVHVGLKDRQPRTLAQAARERIGQLRHLRQLF